ncbi:MAG: hypothetical protein RBS48_06165 [Ignavibacteriaceae bacterium]|jgi:DNA-directed RNA polymerase subunit H (RpoH/RPB5)|nr:hypothetical protein [Ignavibacteriaceae bacterium]
MEENIEESLKSSLSLADDILKRIGIRQPELSKIKKKDPEKQKIEVDPEQDKKLLISQADYLMEQIKEYPDNESLRRKFNALLNKMVRYHYMTKEEKQTIINQMT